MFDLLVAEFREKLVAEVNASQLPATATAYVLQEVLQQVNALAAQQVAKQREERGKAAQPADGEKPA